MREIKFRVFYEQSQTWVYFTIGQTFTDVANAIYSNICINGGTFYQYTGLKDKNGKEIYEGDIVNFHYFFGALGEGLGFVECEHELKGRVEWGEFGWGVSAIKGEHWKGYTGYDDGDGESSFIDLMMMNESSIHEESFEITGNIHQDSLTNKEKK